MVFPLPVSPFEYYYWCDDRPGYPTTFPIELTFAGNLQRDQLSEAVRLALIRHPLLRATIDDSQHPPQWTESSRWPTVSWSHTETPSGCWQARQMDLRSGSGLRIQVDAGREGSRVVFEFHHCCCDALGALRFVEDVLIGYSALVRGDNPLDRFAPLDPGRLAMRADYGLTEANYRANFRDAWITARLWAQWIGRRPALIMPLAKHPTSIAAHDHGFMTYTMANADLRRLRATATRLEATLNDILLRDMFLTLSQWVNQRGEGPRRWLRINMPTSLRRREEHVMPAANVLAFAFLSRRVRGCADRAALLRGIRDETRLIRQARLGLYFIGGLALASKLPAVLPWMLHHQRSFATVCLSNVGRVLARSGLPRQAGNLVCGDVILKNLRGVPPIRPGTQASLAVVTYGHETSICLRCDPHAFRLQDRQAFLEAYVRQLQQTAFQSS